MAIGWLRPWARGRAERPIQRLITGSVGHLSTSPQVRCFLVSVVAAAFLGYWSYPGTTMNWARQTMIRMMVSPRATCAVGDEVSTGAPDDRVATSGTPSEGGELM